MNAIRSILIIGSMALCCTTAQAQVLNRISRAAQNAAERAATRQAEKKAEQAVDKAIDKTFEANAKKETESKEKKTEPAPYKGKHRGGAVDASIFPFDHGIYVEISESSGNEVMQTVYFTRSGQWRVYENKAERHIVKGKQHWVLDLVGKTGSYYDLNSTPKEANALISAALGGKPEEGLELIDFGQEDYLGYTCKKTMVRYPAIDMNMVCLSYGTLVMKSEGRIGSIPTSSRIISMETNTPPASKFEIPAGVSITTF